MKVRHEQSTMQLELNSNTLNGLSIQFNNWIKIELKINGMQIGGKGIENMVLEKKLKEHKFQKDTIPCFFIWE